ncbi:MAG: hypothetical protein ABIP94_12815 [Planctomycetota bacterium]
MTTACSCAGKSNATTPEDGSFVTSSCPFRRTTTGTPQRKRRQQHLDDGGSTGEVAIDLERRVRAEQIGA